MTIPPAVGRYDIGDLITLAATVVASDLITPANPSYFAFTVKSPAGTVATYVFGAAGASIRNPGNGAYAKDITADIDGIWYYRALATGLVQATEEWTFIVDRSYVL